MNNNIVKQDRLCTHLITQQVFWHFIFRFLLCKSPFVFLLQGTPIIVGGGGGGSDSHRWGHPHQRDSGDLRVCAGHGPQRRRHRQVGTRYWGPITTDRRANTHWNLKGIVIKTRYWTSSYTKTCQRKVQNTDKIKRKLYLLNDLLSGHGPGGWWSPQRERSGH